MYKKYKVLKRFISWKIKDIKHTRNIDKALKALHIEALKADRKDNNA